MRATRTRRTATSVGVLAAVLSGLSVGGAAAAPVPGGISAGETPAAATLVGGDLDPSFGVGGRATVDLGSRASGSANGLTIQPDGKIVVVGHILTNQTGRPTRQDAGLTRYNADGSLDSSFGDAGTVLTVFGDGSDAVIGSFFDAAMQPDGKIVAAGTSDAEFALARYDENGNLDPTFGTGGTVHTAVGTGGALAVTIQPNGKIVAVGLAHVSGTDRFAVARYNVDGTLDPSFGGTGTVTTDIRGHDVAVDVVEQPDGKIVVVGDAATGVALVRYDADGSLDSSFDTVVSSFGNESTAEAMAIQRDGRIVVAGSVLGPDPASSRPFLARFADNGQVDPSFGVDGSIVGPPGSKADGMAIRPDGRIVVAGPATDANGTVGAATARYTPDGSLDLSFGHQGRAFAAGAGAGALELSADGRIVTVGGSGFAAFRFLGGTPPTVDTAGPYAGAEGASVALSGAVSDVDGATVRHSWSVVAQSGVDPGATCSIADPAALSTSVACTDDGVYAVTLTADDGGGNPVAETTTLSLANAAPTVAITAPADGSIVHSGTPITVTAAFSDPGANDTHTCSADSVDAAATVSEKAGSGTCTVRQTFSTVGPQAVSITITDDDGGSATATSHLISNRPGEAFGLQATGPIQIAPTPRVACPPDDTRTTAELRTPLATVVGLSASCRVDPGTGATTATASAGTITVLGLIHISGIDSTCTATASGLTGSSHVGSIDGHPIGVGRGSIGIPGVAQVFYNETTTVDAHLSQNAIRVHTLLGEDIVIAGCRLG